jgi:hypothetical protein
MKNVIQKNNLNLTTKAMAVLFLMLFTQAVFSNNFLKKIEDITPSTISLIKVAKNNDVISIKGYAKQVENVSALMSALEKNKYREVELKRMKNLKGKFEFDISFIEEYK